jgi:hypothetical protein
MYDINELIQLKNDILLQKKDVRDDPLLIKDLNRQYSRIQMKIKYHSDHDYRKAKCNAVKFFNKLHSESYNIYQKKLLKKAGSAPLINYKKKQGAPR